ncbi:hypothetical protein CSB07_00305 [Candidatus Gracilibacteria bacterium]|nr:MAG: hypothetical protein CSB07_00305 [Candidatus Gracilibacteria bacterium]PIE85135.1 MAG: hypothetical protein CSA08_03760 [Candidatus Gracilibacteria bacterium]
MNKYKTFIIFIILTAIWSSLFSIIKYFIWGYLQDSIAPDLQVLSGYLSLGGIFAYLLGGAITYTFLKKYLLFSLSFLTLLFVLLAYLVPIETNFGLAIIISSCGFFYGLWVVLRNILIAIEIKKTGMADTKVNAIISVIFIIFLIIGTITGSKIFEMFGHEGFIVIIVLLVISSIVSLYLDYDKISIKELFINGFNNYKLDRQKKFKEAIKNFLPELVYIYKNFTFIIIFASLIWAIGTVVSQKAVEYSVEEFSKLPSEAAFLLLYSSLGAILGNVASSFMGKKRWKYFFFLNIFLGILIILFPHFNGTFTTVGVMAFLIGVVFGGSTNLIESFFLMKIGEENKKEYGASTYGLVLSITIVLIMFLASFIDKKFGFNTLMYTLGTIILLVNILNFKKTLGK